MRRNGVSGVSRPATTHFGMMMIIVVASTTLFASPGRTAKGRLNLPQSQTRIVIPESDHATLKEYFDSLEHNAELELHEDIERILLDVLIEDYHAGCRDMISYWGTIAEGTANLSVRVLFIRDAEKKETKHVLLTYRCASTHDRYRDNYYDERLAVLLVTPTSSSLAFVPHAGDCQKCTDLSRIRFGDVLQHDGSSLISLLIMTSNENPCCGGPDQSREERVDYYLLQETGIKLVASVLRHREENTHDDVDGDMTTIYDSTITVHTDQRGNATHICSHYSVSTNGVLQQTGVSTYFLGQ